jgi:tetratricopeptide (TPR) repeat protein
MMSRFCDSEVVGRILAIVRQFSALVIVIYTVISCVSVDVHAETCTLRRLTLQPMLQDEDFSPVISIQIDGKPRKLLLDTGGFWSMIAPQAAEGHTPRKAAFGSLLGTQGISLEKSVKLSSVQIGPALFSNAEFYLAPPDYFDVDGTLGANWLSNFDVEIDPVGNTASLFSKDHCKGQVVYWAHQDEAAIPFRLERYGNHIAVPLSLNGQTVMAMIDTGAPESVLSLDMARRLFGLGRDSPGMQEAGGSTDERGRTHQDYRYRFKSLEMGGIRFANPWIRVAEMAGGGPDMILGMHQLHALHLYFAYGEQTLYVTSARGDIAARKAAGTTGLSDPSDRINARDFRQAAFLAMEKDDTASAIAAIDTAIAIDPGYIAALLTRAAIHDARAEHDLSAQDFDRALAIDAGNPEIYVERATAEWDFGDRGKAIKDVELALQRDPSFLPGHLARISFDVDSGRRDQALADASTAIRLVPDKPDAYEMRAQIHASDGDYAGAFEDQTMVVKMRPKSSAALNNRCWFGAILGRLDDALDDCDAALEIDPSSASVLDSRAFINIKRGRWDRALKDYNAALNLKPTLASALYGRSLARQQGGDKNGAVSDVAAAEKLDPDIAKHFGK